MLARALDLVLRAGESGAPPELQGICMWGAGPFAGDEAGPELNLMLELYGLAGLEKRTVSCV
tara:strand:+ start:540 stop:725 length:186 start_codon:yes stop_codon:yes gene_type:complete